MRNSPAVSKVRENRHVGPTPSCRAQVDDRVEDYDFGRFGWATDPEGNRIELWEPPTRTGVRTAPNQRLRLTGAAILVFRASTFLQAAPAAYSLSHKGNIRGLSVVEVG